MRTRIEKTPLGERAVVQGTITEADLESLLGFLRQSSFEVIDMSDVQLIDLYGLQIVLSALQTAEADGRPVRFVTGRAVDRVLPRAGLQAAFAGYLRFEGTA